MRNQANKFILLGFMLGAIVLPVNANDMVESLDVISIPDLMPMNLPMDITREEVHSVQYQAESKAVDKAFCKQFGPLELGFRVNPFNLNNAGVRFNLDIVRSIEILETSTNMNQFSEAFKPDPNHNIINKEIKNTFTKIF